MKDYLIRQWKSVRAYHAAVFLSSCSFTFGILREFIIVGILGFSSINDTLQLYLSIFYTIGLSIDAMRLSCINLYTVLPLRLIILFASIISLPFSMIIALIMSYSIGGLDRVVLFIAMIGSYLNLLAALLITYLQRSGLFLFSQLINVMPNFIIIPGIIICYRYFQDDLVFSIVTLTALVPVVQCILLLFAQNNKTPCRTYHYSFIQSMKTFLRHFTSMTGEQLFQIVARSAFYSYGNGYLSLYALAVRLYSAARFILVDTLIGSKLSDWQNERINEHGYFMRAINSTIMSMIIAVIALLISMKVTTTLFHSSVQMITILIIGFYFSTLVRLIYFKINQHENNSLLVMSFASYELLTAMIAYIIMTQFDYPLLSILWLGYIAKPLAQFFLLRKKYFLSVS